MFSMKRLFKYLKDLVHLLFQVFSSVQANYRSRPNCCTYDIVCRLLAFLLALNWLFMPQIKYDAPNELDIMWPVQHVSPLVLHTNSIMVQDVFSIFVGRHWWQDAFLCLHLKSLRLFHINWNKTLLVSQYFIPSVSLPIVVLNVAISLLA